MKVVPTLKWFHNWVGFVLSLSMLIVLVTGVYLASMDMIKRLDDQGQQYQPLTLEQKAKVTETLFERYPDMGTVRFPTAHTPFIEVAARGHSIALDAELNELSERKMSEIPGYLTMFWLHRNFLLGDVGKYFNGGMSFVAGLITLVGIYLWWRVRKGFRFKQSIPKNTRSSSLVKSHIQLGLFISIPLFVLCITGALITFKGLWVGALNTQPTQQVAYQDSEKSDWYSQLQTAQNIWPTSDIVSISKPRARKPDPAKAAERAQAKKPQELNYLIRFDEHSDVWLRNADTIVMNFEQGQVQSALKHSDRPLSGQLAAFVRPLHDAMNMPLKYVVFINIVAIISTIILSFTVVTFYRRVFKKRKA